MELNLIYGLPIAFYYCFDLNQCLVHSASRQHTSNKAMMLLGLMWMTMANLRGSLGLLFMALFKKCFGSLLLAWQWAFLLFWVVVFFQYKKGCLKHNPMQCPFAKTTPCKV